MQTKTTLGLHLTTANKKTNNNQCEAINESIYYGNQYDTSSKTENSTEEGASETL